MNTGRRAVPSACGACDRARHRRGGDRVLRRARAELREVFAFTQGQYLTLRTDVDGQDLRRSYSICAGVDDGELRVGVRKVAGGRFSGWINERLKPGDTVR
jgi:ferredoxin-NADP reductase